PARSPSTVANSVDITEPATAGTSRSEPSSPVRTKIKPASTDAGPIVKLTGKPECTPTPVTVACDRSVVCRLNFIRKPPTTDLPRDWNATLACRFCSKFPQVTADHSHCPK